MPVDSPTRRQVVATLASGALGSLAGCGAVSSGPDPVDPGTAVSVPAGDVTVHSLVARRQFTYRQAGVHPTPYGRDGAVFVLATLTVAGFDADDPRPAERLSLVVDGSTASPARHRPVPDETGRPRMAWRIPAGQAVEDAVLRWGDAAAWDLPLAVTEYVAAPPTFVVERIDVPETVFVGSTDSADVPVSLSVRNDGNRDGRFIVEIGTRAISDGDEHTRTVSAGDRVTLQRAVSLPPSLGVGETATIYANWGSDKHTVTVRLAAD